MLTMRQTPAEAGGWRFGSASRELIVSEPGNACIRHDYSGRSIDLDAQVQHMACSLHVRATNRGPTIDTDCAFVVHQIAIGPRSDCSMNDHYECMCSA
mmetsp:Transcript_9503/g.28946  ORF Transcript_9503/g.28946 Transcript_9503/m.28946 type:complete len:98 (+) Transcript_9503:2746-3039(+)